MKEKKLPVGSLVVNEKTMHMVRPLLSAYTGVPGGVVLAVADKKLEIKVRSLAAKYPHTQALIKLDERMLPQTQKMKPTSLHMNDVNTRISRMVQELRANLAENLQTKKVALNLYLPTGFIPVWTGLSEDSLVQKAATFILDAPNAMPVEMMDFEAIDQMAQLINSQA